MNNVNVSTPLAALIGYPVQHSLSPAIYSFIAQMNQTKLFYKAWEVAPTELNQTMNAIKNLPFIGFNVTIPNKELMHPFMSWVTQEAQVCESINVVEYRNGSLIGHNTDVYGVIQTLKESKIKVKGGSVLLIGAGGAAKAVAYAVALLGAQSVWVQNRNLDRAEKLCTQLKKHFEQTDFHAVEKNEDIPKNIQLYVNATPLGMKGFPKSEFFKMIPINKKAWAFDLIYNPEKTDFILQATQLGLKTLGGLDMLIWQAIATWEIWFGPVSSKTELSNALKQHLKNHLKKKASR